MPSRVIAWVLGWEFVAVVCVVLSARFEPVSTAGQWVIGAALLAGATIHHYVTKPDEERRFGARAGSEHIELTSLWLFPAAVLLPTVPMVALLVVVKAQRYAIARTSLTKHGFTSAAVGLSMLGTHWVTLAVLGDTWLTSTTVSAASGHLGVLLVVVAGIGAYYLVQSVLLPTVRVLSSDTRPTLRCLVGTWTQNAEILGALALAALITVGAAWSPWLLLLALPLAIAGTLLLELLARVRVQIMYDQKTGLLNAHGWAPTASSAVQLAGADRPSAVLMIDVDNLKQLNSRFGHLGADAVLLGIADVLREHIRPGDVPARWGGDEFVVLLPGANADAALGIAERLRVAIETLCIVVTTPAGGAELRLGVDADPVTVTIGIAVAPHDGDCLDVVLDVADQRMLAGKVNHRNRVYPPAHQSIVDRVISRPGGRGSAA
ncbi:MAG TPA: GGDEF domain-containing protein [Pseudonocardiaceae bacterium]|nr:GGDEF domain-containing protein [Pseudonocardiaceae bacterium]